MARPLGQHTRLTLNGRMHFDLPVDRDPLPRPGQTEWDKWAKHEQRKGRAQARKDRLIKNLDEPLTDDNRG